VAEAESIQLQNGGYLTYESDEEDETITITYEDDSIKHEFVLSVAQALALADYITEASGVVLGEDDDE
jgi:hypothetical protein